MESICMATFVISAVLFTEIHGQVITSLRTFAYSSSCSAPYAVEAGLNTIGVEVVLSTSSLGTLAFMWSLLNVVSATGEGSTRSVLTTIYLPNCSSSTPNVSARCTKAQGIIKVVLGVPATLDLNNTTIFVVWKNRHNNFISSFYENTPIIVKQHVEFLRINGDKVPLDGTPHVVRNGSELEATYCVDNLNKHTLSMTLGHVTKNVSNDRCVRGKFAEVSFSESLILSYNETHGECCRAKTRLVFFTPVLMETDKAISDCTALRPLCLECIWVLANIAISCPLLTLRRLEIWLDKLKVGQ